jgi:hypothetical protein
MILRLTTEDEHRARCPTNFSLSLLAERADGESQRQTEVCRTFSQQTQRIAKTAKKVLLGAAWRSWRETISSIARVSI